jgi:hypothetical protein
MGNPSLKNAMEQIALAYEQIAEEDAERLELAWRARELREQRRRDHQATLLAGPSARLDGTENAA